MAPTDQGPLLIPITVAYGRRTADITVPSQMILAELAPALAQALEEGSPSLERPISVLSGSRELSYSQTLASQKVGPGATLTLSQVQDPAPPRVYDDPVEAIGDQVEKNVPAWTSTSATALATGVSTTLLVLTAYLVATSGQNLLSALIAGFAAVIATGVAALVARTSPAGGLALAHTAPLLGGGAAVSFADATTPGGAWIAGGIVIAISSIATFVLPGALRVSAIAPATVGIALTLIGFCILAFPSVPSGPAALISLILAVILLLAPALVVARPQTLDVASTGAMQGGGLRAATVAPRFRAARVAVLSVASGAAAALPLTCALTVFGSTLQSVPEAGNPARQTLDLQADPWGIALVATIGLVLTLTARTQRSRAEVLIHTITGTALIAFACFAAASTHPAAVPVAAAAGLIASFLLLAFAVVAPGARPTLSRVAGALQLVGLVGAFPLVIMCWELF